MRTTFRLVPARRKPLSDTWLNREDSGRSRRLDADYIRGVASRLRGEGIIDAHRFRRDMARREYVGSRTIRRSATSEDET